MKSIDLFLRVLMQQSYCHAPLGSYTLKLFACNENLIFDKVDTKLAVFNKYNILYIPQKG